MKECSKSIPRRLANADFANRYFIGDGIDIGGKPDPLSVYQELFSRMRSVKVWDLEDGDAQYMESVPDEVYDFVHSSHCLEHLRDPKEGLQNWFRIVKAGGHLIFTIPDEDLYEQGIFPSTFNRDHKHTFTIFKSRSWSDQSINVFDLVCGLGTRAEPIKIELLTSSYRFSLPRYDQTLTPIAECGIEVIIRKRTAAEVQAGGRIVKLAGQPPPGIRAQLNQHRDDIATLKAVNAHKPPFRNEEPL